MWTQIRLLLYEQSDQGPHCLPVCKNRFEKSARIFSRRHKQTTFSDAVFLGALRVNSVVLTGPLNWNPFSQPWDGRVLSFPTSDGEGLGSNPAGGGI